MRRSGRRSRRSRGGRPQLPLLCDSRALTKALRHDSFDLLLLDWNLPDFDGIDLLRWARANLEECPPVIMVTSRAEQGDIVEALEAGADDHVTKPIQENVLTARINALLRRSYKGAIETGVEELFGASFDHRSCAVALHGLTATLTTKEFGLALLLFRNMHRAMSRTHLLELVWGRNPDLPTPTLDVHVSFRTAPYIPSPRPMASPRDTPFDKRDRGGDGGVDAERAGIE